MYRPRRDTVHSEDPLLRPGHQRRPVRAGQRGGQDGARAGPDEICQCPPAEVRTQEAARERLRQGGLRPKRSPQNKVSPPPPPARRTVQVHRLRGAGVSRELPVHLVDHLQHEKQGAATVNKDFWPVITHA